MEHSIFRNRGIWFKCSNFTKSCTSFLKFTQDTLRGLHSWIRFITQDLWPVIISTEKSLPTHLFLQSNLCSSPVFSINFLGVMPITLVQTSPNITASTPSSPGRFHLQALADLGGGRRDARPPSGSNFLHFHAVFGKNWSNSMLAPPPLGLAPPPSGKSWIRHCQVLHWLQVSFLSFYFSICT